ncbi:MAG: DUF4097 family beta strand repeat protein [Bacteroidetes bacterium]|nr:DUF4097 family beta strand repeat protein [Bacteroidota bacterium]
MRTQWFATLALLVMVTGAMAADGQGTSAPKAPKAPAPASYGSGSSNAMAASTTAQTRSEQTFNVGKNSALDISVSGCEIVIRAWEKNVIEVTVEGLDEEDLEYVKMKQNGDEVTVTYRPKWNTRGGGRFEVSVPSQTKLDMNTSGGNIELVGTLSGDAIGHTSGGDITIDKIKGTVRMTTSGGDIRTGDIEGKAELRTSGGNITIANVNGESTVNTSGGDIRIGNIAKKLDARTSGGDIEVGDIGGDANVGTSGGDIRVGKVSGNAYLRTAGGDLKLLGASGTVEARTSGGDIDLKNITGSIEASTAGGDITAELNPSGKGESQLKTAGGDIRLWLPASAKASVEATIRIRDNGGWGGSSKRSKYEVRSDFPSLSYDKDGDRDEIRARYQLNGGGEVITLEATNGYIDIKKR